jgi:hypothetical protein
MPLTPYHQQQFAARETQKLFERLLIAERRSLRNQPRNYDPRLSASQEKLAHE